ncbi:Centromere protein S [Trichinella zimbabwensis]|uniref:Centromere protein S n=1 Tax=Trichinella zimbabwensis TaxID=268475 RepID=A0A0V1HKI3_9BILA|nr:Centromere protein S [Trichinella zimbabwensis]
MDDDEEKVKCDVLCAVEKICESVSCEKSVKFSNDFQVNMAEIATSMLNTWIEDLAAFAKYDGTHAKRVRIGQDDVRLLVRRNQSLLQHINSECCESANEGESKIEKLDKTKLNLASSDMGLSSDMELYP